VSVVIAASLQNDRYRQLLAAKILPILLGTLVLRRLGLAVLHHPGNPIFWLALASEAMCFVMTLTSYEANEESVTLKSVSLAYIPSYFFMIVSLCKGEPLVPLALATTIMAVGLGLQLFAKLKLGRRFGVLPAHRGVMTDGPYGLVRHPIYLGYLFVHLAFILANFAWWNLVLLVFVYTLLGFRAIEEETVLSRDPAYQAYQQRVRFRFIPGLF
jgi:protein-S-isoprenylcysteine O-methyltransferase Ste14